jgi:hypothetical protein
MRLEESALRPSISGKGSCSGARATSACSHSRSTQAFWWNARSAHSRCRAAGGSGKAVSACRASYGRARSSHDCRACSSESLS